jgi:hypothetical protein
VKLLNQFFDGTGQVGRLDYNRFEQQRVGTKEQVFCTPSDTAKAQHEFLSSGRRIIKGEVSFSNRVANVLESEQQLDTV